MDDRIAAALERLEGPADDMLSRLCQHLESYVLRNQIAFDQGAQEFVFSLRRRREPYLDLFESDLHQKLEKKKLCFQVHRNDQCLVAVTKIHGTPHRRLLDRILLCPFQACFRRIEKLFFIFVMIHHISGSFYNAPYCQPQRLSSVWHRMSIFLRYLQGITPGLQAPERYHPT